MASKDLNRAHCVALSIDVKSRDESASLTRKEIELTRDVDSLKAAVNGELMDLRSAFEEFPKFERPG